MIAIVVPADTGHIMRFVLEQRRALLRRPNIFPIDFQRDVVELRLTKAQLAQAAHEANVPPELEDVTEGRMYGIRFKVVDSGSDVQARPTGGGQQT